MSSTAALILAAGASTRLGSPKQLAKLGDETLLERAIRIASQAGCAPIFVVLGANAERIQAECGLTGTHIILNADWAEGMGSSVRAGVAQLPPATTCLVVMTCDQPAVTADHVKRLIAESKSLGCNVCSAYGARRGVPACFPAESFAGLSQLAGDAGARGLLASAATIDLLDGELDVDTPETLEEARKRFS